LDEPDLPGSFPPGALSALRAFFFLSALWALCVRAVNAVKKRDDILACPGSFTAPLSAAHRFSAPQNSPTSPRSTACLRYPLFHRTYDFDWNLSFIPSLFKNNKSIL